ncbi:DUF5320 family protein [Candidatus Aerophobetes bacterium]|nr:DUF5320 family protein [Candidatus Aerophobetes bacterium]
MKIAVSSTGTDLNAQVDPRLGRCQYLIIVDPETMEFEAIQNTSVGAMHGAGIQTAQMIANKGVSVVLTGNSGPNAFQTLSAAGIQVIVGVNGQVKQAIERYKRGEFKSTTQASVSSHFGTGAGSTPTPGTTPGAGTFPGMGMGQGRGMGMGGGRGMGRGMGMGQGMMGGGFQGMPYGAGTTPPQMPKDQELQFLKNQIQNLSQQLEEINKRIKEIEKK